MDYRRIYKEQEWLSKSLQTAASLLQRGLSLS